MGLHFLLDRAGNCGDERVIVALLVKLARPATFGGHITGNAARTTPLAPIIGERANRGDKTGRVPIFTSDPNFGFCSWFSCCEQRN